MDLVMQRIVLVISKKAQRCFEEGLTLNRESGDDRCCTLSPVWGNLASANGDQEKSKTFF